MVSSVLQTSPTAFLIRLSGYLWDSCLLITLLSLHAAVFLKYRLLRISPNGKLVHLFSWFVVIYVQHRRKHSFLSCESICSCYIAVAFNQMQLRMGIKAKDYQACNVISQLHWLSWKLQRSRTIVTKITCVTNPRE